MKYIYLLLLIFISHNEFIFGVESCPRTSFQNNLKNITNTCNRSEEQYKRDEKNIIEHLFNKLIDNIIDVRIVKGQNRQCRIESVLCQDNEIGRVISSVIDSLDNNIGISTEQIRLPGHLFHHSNIDDVLAKECNEVQESLDQFCQYTKEKEKTDQGHARDIAKGLGYSIMVKRVDDQKERARNRDELISKYRCLQLSQLGKGSNTQNNLDKLIDKYVDKKQSRPSALRDALKEIRTTNSLGNNYLDSIKTNIRNKLAIPESKTFPNKVLESLVTNSSNIIQKKGQIPIVDSAKTNSVNNVISSNTSKAGTGYGSVGGSNYNTARQYNNNSKNIIPNPMDAPAQNSFKSSPNSNSTEIPQNIAQDMSKETTPKTDNNGLDQKRTKIPSTQSGFNASSNSNNTIDNNKTGNFVKLPDLDNTLKNAQAILLGIDPKKRRPFEIKEAAERKFRSDCINENKIENDPKNAGKLSICINMKMREFYEMQKITKISDLLKYQISKSLK